jgi:ABC-type spermidine/putrescine transport system permease subunit II
MKNILHKINNTKYTLAAAITIAAMSVENALAAGTTVGGAADNVGKQIGQIGKMTIAGMFLLGIVAIGAGLSKLKQAAETQGQQVKYSEGMWRIGIGAALVAIPAFSGMLSESIGLGTVTMTDKGGQSF